MFKSTFLKNYFKPLRVNFFSLILFELIYKALGTYIFFPFLLHILRNLITGFGLSLITTDNIRLIFQSPMNIFLLITLLVILLYYFLIEITVINVGLNAGMENRSVGFFKLVYQGLIKSFRYLSINNWFAFIIILFFLPVLHIGLQSGINELLYLGLYIEYYTDFVFSSSLFIGVMLTCLIFMTAFSFTFIVFVKYNLNIITACYLNFKIFKDNFLKTVSGILKVLFITILLLAGLLILYFAIGTIIYLVIFYLRSGSETFSTTETLRDLINILTPFLISLVALVSALTPLLYFSGIIGTLFTESNQTRVVKGRHKVLKAGVLSLVILCYSIVQGSVIAKSIDDDALLIVQTGGIITAHRGNSGSGYENTKAAFESAIQNGAEYIEFDVQKTGDGELVVSHTDVINTTHGMIKISQLPFNVIKDLEIVDKLTGVPTGQHISTLDEVLEICKNRAKMNIEMKMVENDDSLVPEVINKIKEHNVQDQCFIASGVYNYVNQIEQIDPELKTLFLTNSNYGDIENLNFDSLSLSQEAIDKDTVDRLHLRGKMIQAWTLENEEQIKEMIDLDVDFLIVDDVRMAQIALANNRPTQLEQILDLLELIILRI